MLTQFSIIYFVCFYIKFVYQISYHYFCKLVVYTVIFKEVPGLSYAHLSGFLSVGLSFQWPIL
jgi:hypothetical protein